MLLCNEESDQLVRNLLLFLSKDIFLPYVSICHYDAQSGSTHPLPFEDQANSNALVDKK